VKTRLVLILSAVALTTQAAAARPPSLVSVGRDGRLVYDHDERGNRVPDFSRCGYAGGDKAIPTAPVRIVVEPRSGDSTGRIQRALDFVAGLPLDSNGLRGAVLLLRGRHTVLGGLRITSSGVVLRGQGMGDDGTVLTAAGLDRRTLIRVTGRNNRVTHTSATWRITDDYVPVGATSFHLEDVGGLKAGDFIQLNRPSTSPWIERLGATDFGGGVGGGWKPGTRDITWDRVIKSIRDRLVTMDAPITTALERECGGGWVITRTWPGQITNVGVENLHLECTFEQSNPKDEDHSWCAITMENAADAWVRQVAFNHFAGSAVGIYETGQRITAQDCLSFAPVSEIGGYRRHTFFTMGQQTLFLRCYAEHGRHDFSVGHCAAGPNAFVQCEAHAPLGDSGPIESWASGVLYDNVVIDGNAITLGYRPGNNAGLGWSAANCVLWNCSASVIRCWNPPGARNWSFGSWASFEGDGIWRSSNDFMKPDSLFAAQLKDRLDAEAAERLQLMPRPREESSNPPLDRAQELAAASHLPPLQLKDYIASASERESIPSQPDNAKRVEELPAPPAARRPLRSQLVITNGWLTVNGKLLIGGSAGVTWWRGNIRPGEAPSFGPGVTRFVPGRVGLGFTDELNEVADSLVANGTAALDHNYGLWYDRRRDDHERVRRMNGDVLPPFYEQPFARSGQGAAWDGLSKYDLTQFNPWYWSRLREFAGICDERGLLLFHQNYFQHNILEAGAHWADFPWRSANNVNHTGFPEPPPYAGDKRIFQAELFYDVTHPVRRKLHEAYIQQCLDNFTNNGNVVQFTSAEFTGPLHFVQFWIDTIAEWERGRVRSSRRGEAPAGSAIDESLLTPAVTKPLIALSATKDVQDAILADPKRSAVVDMIDFRYWWRTDKGEFAPPGGKNLAPRQFERRWRGGRPNDVNLAGMAAEYRTRFPAKPLICDFASAGWAWVCAGGSMPRLPETTDGRLLAAIPQMKPVRWPSASPGQLALAQGGLAYLICPGRRDFVTLDLTQAPGEYTARWVDSRSGQPTDRCSRVTGGKAANIAVPFRPAVLWVNRNN